MLSIAAKTFFIYKKGICVKTFANYIGNNICSQNSLCDTSIYIY